MKEVIKDILLGVLIIFVVQILEFIVTLPFGEIAYSGDRASWAIMINKELSLAAIPAGIATLIFSWLAKTTTKKDALRKSIIWTTILALFYVAIGIGNANLDLIFGNIGIYALLICAFLGPILYSILKRQR